MYRKMNAAGLLLGLALLAPACSKHQAEDTWKKTEIIDMDRIVSTDTESGNRFDILTAKSTGLDFNNVIQTTHKVNVYYNSYAYNGAGVGIGDLNNDGLPDVYMAGNWVDDRIFLNKGNLQFEDISERTGIQEYPGYSTGVTMADVNGDGWLDIYVCRDWFKEEGRKQDRLFINNGDLTFTESSAEYGLVFDAFSTSANFFDADNDGDLDLYVVTHPDDWNDKQKLKYFVKVENGQNQSDFFFRNEGGKFVDASREAGINNHGYGLSVTTGDINNDGWMDLYVANDFVMYDFLYLNDGDGTFTDVTKDEIKRNSHFAMGADVVDINNDGLLDIYTVDMDLEDNYTVKTFTFVTRKEMLEAMENGGYHTQYVGNVLQLNNGNDHFTEVARMAGVSTTGWSWSPQFADYDNDGDRDLFVSNGNGRDFHVDNTVGYHRLRRATRIGDSVMYQELLEKYPTQPLVTPNAMFENNGDLSFTDQRHGWGVYYPSASYGAAYADLDNDGDIDIIANNINEDAFVYRNNTNQLEPEKRWLTFAFEGPKGNRLGIGARVEVITAAGSQFDQHSVVRGYMSSVDPRSHFGLGSAERADKVIVTWPDGKQQILEDVAAGQVVTLRHADADRSIEPGSWKPYGQADPVLARLDADLGLDFVHQENEYDDFDREFLIPHKLSYLGPAASVADVNGDGRDDVAFGGAQGQATALYLQGPDGRFARSAVPAFEADRGHEDMGLLFFDADGNGTLDLYAVSGGSDFPAEDERLRDRLYLGDGRGGFERAADALPDLRASGAAVAANDVDGDGDLDLFVAGRVVPGLYPDPGRSFLLRNDGGRFTEATAEWAPGLERAGMVSSALWSDADGDGDRDLLLVGEWTALELWRNDGGRLAKVDDTGVQDVTGWWNSLVAGDFDNDGDMDYVAGNFGTNCKYKPTDAGAIEVFADDFDGNGTNDIVMGYYQNGVLYPIKSRERMVEQCPILLDQIPTWHEYGVSTVYDLFGKEAMENARARANAKTFRSTYFQNEGGRFVARDLPNLLQVSSVYGMRAADLDGDGNLDLVTHGNYYYPEVETNRQDASVGLVLMGAGDGSFRALSSRQSGLFSELDAKALVWVRQAAGNRPLLIGTNNNGPLRLHQPTDVGRDVLYAAAGDIGGEIEHRDGRRTRLEFGQASYLGQSAEVVFVPSTATRVTFTDGAGQSRTVWTGGLASR